MGTNVLLHLATLGFAAGLALLLGRALSWDGTALAWILGAAGVAAIAAAGTVVLAVARRSERRAGRTRSNTAEAPIEPLVLGRHDALTGLPNRDALLERLDAAIAGQRRGESTTAVLTVDLAGFRTVNTELGHAAGDLLLRHTGARLLARVREHDLLARLGGDRFAVVQLEAADPASAATLGARLLTAFDQPFDLYGHLTRVGARVGIAIAPGDSTAGNGLLGCSARGLERAKGESPGLVRFCDEAMDRDHRDRQILRADLAGALERDQLEVSYQPQIDIVSRRVVGVEALPQWHHPERGSVPTERVVTLAEDAGATREISAWLLARACADAVRWQRAGATELRIAVSLSPPQLQDGELPELVADLLNRTGLAPEHLELAATEPAVDSELGLATLGRIRDRGVRISIRDFGAGCAAFGHLRRFPFDTIALDPSLVGALEHDPSAAAIVRASLSAAHSLSIGSVAKGVDSQAQLDLLQIEGCDLAQGCYFAPPMHPREVDAIIAAGQLIDANSKDQKAAAMH